MKRNISSAAAISVAFCCVALLLAAAGAASAAEPPPRTRGTIERLDGDTLTLATRGGQKATFKLTPDTKIVGAIDAQLDAIKPDTYIGTSAAPQSDGTLKAIEVHVFPESMRGTGDGHYPWDLDGANTMTNGAVGALAGTSGRTLTVKYRDGEKKVVVPEGTPVVAFEPADRSIVKQGARALVIAPKGADGTQAAVFLVVGENGVNPPM